MVLSDEDRAVYKRLLKGYEGELAFDEMTRKLQCECIILNDLVLEIGGKTFQIDTLIITAKPIYLFEVKNFEEEYYYDSKEDQFIKLPKLVVDNPLVQLKRSETTLLQLLRQLGYTSISIHASVVFINSEFTLLQAPLDKPLILPTQLNSFLRKFNNIPSGLTDAHWQMADKLCALHQTETRYDQLPTYTFEDLQPGMRCRKCGALSVTVVGKKGICQCGESEKVTDAIIRQVQEFQLLFPNEKITTKIIHAWCGEVFSKKRICNTLQRNFKRVGIDKLAYYE
ncbi:nuclease-related domain-containing protein [Bacillus sp. FJAT-27225]|uniref:nuclease-related domain-containing protein n=1 Tax=Bacillus sp. FJAT-27225 TaxID=1743144 RepID=UPI0020C7B737|nr:nuclease-related domain-containing protein [Bacillus sp. FJAT-27225]